MSVGNEIYRRLLAVLFWSVLPLAQLALLVGQLAALCRAVRVLLDVESGRSPSKVWVGPRCYERRLRAALRATAFWPFGGAWLRRCLLLWLALRAEKLALRIGVRQDEGGAFSAHSRVQVGNKTLDPTAERFLLLESLTAPSA